MGNTGIHNAFYDVTVYPDYSEVGPKLPGEVDVQKQYNDGAYAELGASSESSSYEKDDVYKSPGFNEESLYELLQNCCSIFLIKESIRLGEILGSGQFGDVFKGVWQSADKEVEVAIKTLKKGSDTEDRIKFLQEAAIMSQFQHPSIVTMFGLVRDGESILLVLELLDHGDLRSHLLKEGSMDCISLTDHILLSYCRHIANGMQYLSVKGFVHRDLAARNILMDASGRCKIADFGMSRNLMYDSYYVSHGGMIPVKWTAPEALHYRKYTSASDVWSYGALMYEIWSVGHKPFEMLTNSEVIKAIDSGYRLPPPPGCPREIYSLMIECWHPQPASRPSFMTVGCKLSQPDSTLLYWSKEDVLVHEKASLLGADLEAAADLYKDLQITYKTLK